jgi:hypothetical protein
MHSFVDRLLAGLRAASAESPAYHPEGPENHQDSSLEGG